jgi:hypothetical protein
MTFIHYLVHAIPNRGTESEKISDEWGFRLHAVVARNPNDEGLAAIGGGHVRCPRIAVHDCYNAKCCDEHGKEFARFPVELEKPYGDDVREEGVRVPDCGDIAQSVMTGNFLALKLRSARKHALTVTWTR